MKNPTEYIGKLDNAGSVFLVNMRPSLWETIMPVLTMFFLQAEPPDFFHRFQFQASLNVQAIFIIRKRRFGKQRTI